MDPAKLTWMRRAIELAERGRGHVEPNPLVGAVLVKDGRIVGEGWHERFGADHAEINALRQAGEAARGATCFVTLEPCCHTGKTPPCTDSLITAGIRNVEAALEDPFPQVHGKSAARLRAAGIPVALGLCDGEARRQNAPYLKLLETQCPYVHAKWAMTLDGKIASRSGASKWISNDASRRRAHALRGRMDAIVIGIGTALADDPMLTARPEGPRVAMRVILDSAARLPPGSQLAQSARGVPTCVVVGTGAPPSRVAALTDAGCQVLGIETAAPGGLRLLLAHLGRQRATNILVEGGSGVLGSFLEAGEIDEVHVFVSPRILGGAEAKTPVGGPGIDQVADALSLTEMTTESIEGDIYVHALAASRAPPKRL